MHSCSKLTCSQVGSEPIPKTTASSKSSRSRGSSSHSRNGGSRQERQQGGVGLGEGEALGEGESLLAKTQMALPTKIPRWPGYIKGLLLLGWLPSGGRTRSPKSPTRSLQTYVRDSSLWQGRKLRRKRHTTTDRTNHYRTRNRVFMFSVLGCTRTRRL